jgi:hypothetical protein
MAEVENPGRETLTLKTILKGKEKGKELSNREKEKANQGKAKVKVNPAKAK